MRKLYVEGLSVNNCNCRLTSLYRKRDEISNRIDRIISRYGDVTEAEKEYDEVLSIIEELCEFRRNNPGCLLEGDPGYCFH